MKENQTLNRTLEAFAWGALFIWWGITELAPVFPDGSGLFGSGLILLGVNAARAMSGIPTRSFTTTIGILALVWGALELAGSLLQLPFEIPIFAILLIVFGAIVIAGELAGRKQINQQEA